MNGSESFVVRLRKAPPPYGVPEPEKQKRDTELGVPFFRIN